MWRVECKLRFKITLSAQKNIAMLRKRVNEAKVSLDNVYLKALGLQIESQTMRSQLQSVASPKTLMHHHNFNLAEKK